MKWNHRQNLHRTSIISTKPKMINLVSCLQRSPNEIHRNTNGVSPVQKIISHIHHEIDGIFLTYQIFFCIYKCWAFWVTQRNMFKDGSYQQKKKNLFSTARMLRAPSPNPALETCTHSFQLYKKNKNQLTNSLKSLGYFQLHSKK